MFDSNKVNDIPTFDEAVRIADETWSTDIEKINRKKGGKKNGTHTFC